MNQQLKDKVDNTENKGKGPKYYIDIEGTQFPWDNDTITTEEIIELGGWTSDQGAIEVNLKEGTERTLQPNEVVEIKPGQGFSKKIGFKRGDNGYE